MDRGHNTVSALTPVARRAKEAMAADAVIVSARNIGSTRFGPVSADGLSWEQAEEVHKGLGKVNAALRRGELVEIPDLGSNPRTADGVDWGSYSFQSVLSVPLVWEDNVLGGIHALDPGIVTGSDEAANLMHGLARHAAVVVANTRLTHKAARLSHELESMLALDEVVLSARSIEEMDKALTAKAAPLTGAVTGGIMVWDEERELLRMLPGAFGVSGDDAVSCQVRADHPTSNSARVFATGKSYMSNDARGDPAILQDYVDLFHVERILTIPLSLGRRRIGVLHLANKPTPFTQEDLQKAERIAPRIATVVELGRAVFRLRRQQRLTAALVNMAVGTASGGTIEDLLPRVLAEVGEITEMNALALVFPEGRPIAWHSGATRSIDPALLAKAKRLKVAGEEDVPPRAAGDPGHSAFHTPVHLEGAHIATLVAVRNRAEPFGDPEREGFVRLANLTALAWATETNRRQRAELARLRERQRIADDLHDTVAQILFAAQVNLESVLETDQLPAPAAKTISHARALLLRGDTEIRDVIHELSRPIRADLSHRLTLLVEELEEELDLGIHLKISDQAATAAANVRKPVADAMIRTAQEAIVNAGKHAAPNTVNVRLVVSRGGRLLLTITDDGIGIGNGNGGRSNGHGLSSVRRVMREHGGLVRVGSGRYGGTKVSASIPV